MIAIEGCPGAGKTLFARWLADNFNIAVMDDDGPTLPGATDRIIVSQRPTQRTVRLLCSYQFRSSVCYFRVTRLVCRRGLYEERGFAEFTILHGRLVEHMPLWRLVLGHPPRSSAFGFRPVLGVM